MKWTRAAAGISISLNVFASVAFLVTFLLGPGSPTGAAVGNAAAIAAFAFVCWLPIALLVAAAEGLWCWLNEARAGPTR